MVYLEEEEPASFSPSGGSDFRALQSLQKTLLAWPGCLLQRVSRPIRVLFSATLLCSAMMVLSLESESWSKPQNASTCVCSWMEDSFCREESREASDATLWRLLLWSAMTVGLCGASRSDSEQETECCWERRDLSDLLLLQSPPPALKEALPRGRLRSSRPSSSRRLRLDMTLARRKEVTCCSFSESDDE